MYQHFQQTKNYCVKISDFHYFQGDKFLMFINFRGLFLADKHFQEFNIFRFIVDVHSGGAQCRFILEVLSGGV